LLQEELLDDAEVRVLVVWDKCRGGILSLKGAGRRTSGSSVGLSWKSGDASEVDALYEDAAFDSEDLLLRDFFALMLPSVSSNNNGSFSVFLLRIQLASL
jgi:hypothetical protein